MKKILVIFGCNNGYHCSCCGQWWEETETYEVDDSIDVKQFVQELKEKVDKNNDYGRQGVDSAYLISEVIYE